MQSKKHVYAPPTADVLLYASGYSLLEKMSAEGSFASMDVFEDAPEE